MSAVCTDTEAAVVVLREVKQEKRRFLLPQRQSSLFTHISCLIRDSRPSPRASSQMREENETRADIRALIRGSDATERVMERVAFGSVLLVCLVSGEFPLLSRYCDALTLTQL